MNGSRRKNNCRRTTRRYISSYFARAYVTRIKIYWNRVWLRIASLTDERRKSVIFGWVMSDRYASGITQHEERHARMAWLDDATRM